MVQQKKALVRDAILEGAFRLFSKHGYAATTLAAIAKSADVSPGNVYIYFGSKLEILYAIYDPWLRARIRVLEEELSAIRSPRSRLKRLLVALWRDIPAEENGFRTTSCRPSRPQTPARATGRRSCNGSRDGSPSCSWSRFRPSDAFASAKPGWRTSSSWRSTGSRSIATCIRARTRSTTPPSMRSRRC
jgi:AcrR family transcriptional regulator